VRPKRRARHDIDPLAHLKPLNASAKCQVPSAKCRDPAHDLKAKARREHRLLDIGVAAKHDIRPVQPDCLHSNTNLLAGWRLYRKPVGTQHLWSADRMNPHNTITSFFNTYSCPFASVMPAV